MLDHYIVLPPPNVHVLLPLSRLSSISQRYCCGQWSSSRFYFLAQCHKTVVTQVSFESVSSLTVIKQCLHSWSLISTDRSHLLNQCLLSLSWSSDTGSPLACWSLWGPCFDDILCPWVLCLCYYHVADAHMMLLWFLRMFSGSPSRLAWRMHQCTNSPTITKRTHILCSHAYICVFIYKSQKQVATCLRMQ